MSGLPGVRIDNETIGELIAYMKAVYPRVMPYENQVLSFLYNNRQTPVQTREYVDSISPNFIAKRADHSFMTGEMAETYRKLAAYCSIPKTCYALIGAIQNNPESPLKNGKYYAKTINRKFYDEYILSRIRIGIRFRFRTVFIVPYLRYIVKLVVYVPNRESVSVMDGVQFAVAGIVFIAGKFPGADCN